MTTLAADLKREFDAGVDPHFEDYPMIADDIIYEGAACGLDSSGNIQPFVASTTEFVGFATKKVDNTGGAAGDLNAQVRTQGKARLPVTGVTGIDDVGKIVYASDDNLFTLTLATGDAIGKVARHITSTECMVYFQADFQHTGAVA